MTDLRERLIDIRCNVSLNADEMATLDEAIERIPPGPPPWLGGHCKYKNLRHEDCPGKGGLPTERPCICQCHQPKDSDQ